MEISTFGALLRQYRLEAGLTQDALAERAGLSLRGLSDIERGERRWPYADTVNRLARALGLNRAQHEALSASRKRSPSPRVTLDSTGSARQPRIAANTMDGYLSVLALPSPNGSGGIENASRPPGAEHVTHRTNLPAQLPSLVGREEAILSVGDRLMGARPGLLTLTGAGGSGKTRLAVAVAQSLLHKFADGVWFVDLAPLSDGALAPAAVLSALGLRLRAGQSAQEQLLEALPGRSLLLVLDNCEHLVDPCAALADSLLRASSTLRILATSREPLRVAGERIWRVPGLALDEIDGGPAVKLFVERAQAVQPEFALTGENLPAITSVCSRLGGLPLAIELAAARSELLPPAQILTRLDDVFLLLAGRRRGGPTRHQTIRASIAWSWQLLSPDEQLLFAQLAVFAGGWTLEAAEAVCSRGEFPRSRVLDELESLASKSLVSVDFRDGAMVRHRFLETIRQYARQQLDLMNIATDVERRHAEYFVQFAEAAQQHLRTGAQTDWLHRLDSERENFRAVFRWAVKHRAGELGLRLGAALMRYWRFRGDLTEGRSWLDHFLNESEAGAAPGSIRGKGLAAVGALAFAQGHHGIAAARFEESLELHRQLQDDTGIAIALNNLGLIAIRNSDFVTATDCFERSIGLSRQVGNLSGLATSLMNFGRLLRRLGDCARALAFVEEGMSVFRELGDRLGTGHSFIALAEIARESGDLGRAEELLEESLRLFKTLGDTPGTAWALGEIGRVTHERGQYARAQLATLESLRVNRDSDDFHGIAVCLLRLASFAVAQRDYERAAHLLGGVARIEERAGNRLEPDDAQQRASMIEVIKMAIGAQPFTAAYEGARRAVTTAVIRLALEEGAVAVGTMANEP